MGAMTNYLEDKLIGHVFMNVAYTVPSGLYVCLFTTMATDLGTDGVEPSGGSYARQSVAPGTGWTQATGGAGRATNAATVTFTNLPACTVVGTGVWDAVTGGNLLTYGAASASRTVAAGDNLSVSASGLVITFD